MIEDALREGLRSALTAEPPLGFSTDELIDKARRTARRRRTVLGSLATVAAVAIGTVGAVSVAGQSAQPPAQLPTMKAASTEVEKVGESIAKLIPRYLPGATRTAVVPVDNGAAVTYQAEGKPAVVVYKLGECKTSPRRPVCQAERIQQDPNNDDTRLDADSGIDAFPFFASRHSGSLTVPLRLLIVEDGAMLSALAPTACQSLLELCDEDVDFMPMSNDQTERVIIDDDLYQPARDDVRKEQLERELTELKKKKQQLEQDRQKSLEREQEITQKKIELELLKKKEQEERAKQEQERSEGK